MDERERRAARSILAVLGDNGLTVEPRDVREAPAGTHDFDLRGTDEAIAVEVSTLADSKSVGDHAAWDSLTDGLTVLVDGLSQGWMLTVEVTGNARRTTTQVAEWLHTLEREGISHVETREWQRHVFSSPEHRPASYETLRAMAAAGVSSAFISAPLDPGTCMFIIAWGGDSYDPTDRHSVTDFVSDQLSSAHQGDIEKLERAETSRRFLFLWLDAYSYFHIARSLDHGDPEGDLTNLGEVDEVWIGRPFKDGTASIYRWSPDNGWSRHHIDAAALDPLAVL